MDEWMANVLTAAAGAGLGFASSLVKGHFDSRNERKTNVGARSATDLGLAVNCLVDLRCHNQAMRKLSLSDIPANALGVNRKAVLAAELGKAGAEQAILEAKVEGALNRAGIDHKDPVHIAYIVYRGKGRGFAGKDSTMNVPAEESAYNTFSAVLAAEITKVQMNGR